jgi:hypothetical protein
VPGVDCAGLDVLAQEPPDADDPILKLDNVILAPHALCWTDQLFAANGAADVKTVLDVQHGRTPYIVVNRAVLGTERWQRRMADFRGHGTDQGLMLDNVSIMGVGALTRDVDEFDRHS